MSMVRLKRVIQRLVRYHVLYQRTEEIAAAWRMSGKMRAVGRRGSFDAVSGDTNLIFRSKGRFDRSGAQVHEDLMAYSFCFHCGYVYGGSIGGFYFEEHLRLCRLLGLPEPQVQGEVSLFGEAYREVRWDSAVGPRPRGMSRWGRFLAFLFGMKIDDGRLLDVDRLYSPEFRVHLQKGIRFPRERREHPRAVVHIRRGDIGRPEYAHRYLNNAYFIDLIERVQRALPRVEVVIHSERDSPETFDDFIELGCVLKLDSTLEEAWRDMILADILILSKSSFSYVPALFNPNLVIYTPFWHDKLSDWVDVTTADVEHALMRYLQSTNILPAADRQS